MISDMKSQPMGQHFSKGLLGVSLVTVMGGIVISFPNSYIEVLTPSASE